MPPTVRGGFGAFGPALRAARERAGFTQKAVAGHIGVDRAQVSQWETNRHLPLPSTIEKLGRLLGAGDELTRALEEPRAGAPAPTPPVPAPGPPDGPTLYDVHRALGRVLVDELVVQDGRPLGWRRDFRDDLGPTAFTTASAIRLLTLLQDPPYVDRRALGEELLRFRYREGGWGTRNIGRRPEATAVVIDALERIGADVDVDKALGELEGLMVGANLHHTYVLVEALSICARLRPGSAFTRRIAATLLETRNTTTGAWPEKRPAVRGATSAPSTAHTARAMTVLAHALERGLGDPQGEYDAAVTSAQAWLVENYELIPVRENVEPDGQKDLEIRHFTPALVTHALASVREPSWELLETALLQLWTFYNPAIGRWQWDNGDVPVWMQVDALRAVTAAHTRLTTVPVPEIGQ